MLDHRSDIVNVLSMVAYYFDEREPEKCAGLFTQDVSQTTSISGTVTDGPFVGREALAERYRTRMAARAGREELRHVVSNFIFDQLTSDSAQVTSYLSMFVIDHEGTHIQTTGVYHDSLRRETDGWRICERRTDLDSHYAK